MTTTTLKPREPGDLLVELGKEIPAELNEICDCGGKTVETPAEEATPPAKLFAV